MTWVIAICGTMGSGKSTVVENVAAALPDCEMLFEDDYNKTTERSLEEINAWWSRGADVGEFDLSGLLAQLAAGCPDKSQDQGTDVPRSPEVFSTASCATEKVRSRSGTKKLLLLETHFGRLHPALNPWIDFQCWIDVPADIAVARKIAQLSAQLQMQSPHNGTFDGLRWIESFCKGYLTTTRKLFEMQRQKVRDLSDVSIDGQAAPLDVCAEFLQRLPQKYKPE